ncbi:MAG: hypothetical protein R2844_19625 [Caldilineales bacterium]
MKKVDTEPDELRPEYRREDFGIMTRGKYAAKMKDSSNVVVLDPDVVEAFPNAQAVNQALRSLLELARSSVHS